MRYSLGVYKTYRNYGGPQEGGWWFDSGRLEYRSKKTFFRLHEALDYYDSLQAKIDSMWNDPRGVRADLNSALGEYSFRVHVGDEEEDPLVDFFPSERPRYE